MKSKIVSSFLFVALLVIFSQLSASCADSLKIGSGNFKPSGPVVASTIGNGISVNFAGRVGTRVGTSVFLFNATADKIVPGAEFDVVANNAQVGQVHVLFTDQTTNRSGTSKLIASDEESTATGKIKILSGDSSKFTFSVSAQFKGILQRISNPLKGNMNGKESRPSKVVRMSGKLTASKI